MLSDAIDKADLNSLPTELQQIRFGQLLQCAIPQNRSAVNHNTAAANPYVLATLQATRLGYVPAAVVLRATVKAGAVTGELTPKLYGVTPATTEVAVAPNGDIVTLAADAITDMDVTYIPETGDLYEVTLPVPVSGILTLPAFIQAMKPKLLCEAELTVGSVVGKKIINVPGTAAATLKAAFGIAKTTVVFLAADVGASQGTARLKLLVAPQTNAAALLAATETT